MEQVGASYLLVLEDLGSDELKAAAAHYLSTGRFFPTPGDLRSAAMDLRRISFGIPAPLEAWAQVQNALRHVPGVACEVGQRLLDACAGKADRAYYDAVNAHGAHEDVCDDCRRGGYREVYSHELVERTVRLLGGREALMTGNPAADRKQFIDAYREIVDRELERLSLLPEVQKFLEQHQGANARLRMADLARKLTVEA